MSNKEIMLEGTLKQKFYLIVEKFYHGYDIQSVSSLRNMLYAIEQAEAGDRQYCLHLDSVTKNQVGGGLRWSLAELVGDAILGYNQLFYDKIMED